MSNVDRYKKEISFSASPYRNLRYSGRQPIYLKVRFLVLFLDILSFEPKVVFELTEWLS